MATDLPDTTVPLVSCIMPTANRRRFVPLAIRYFLAQDYPNAELLILDDGEDPVGDLVPQDPRIRYVRETRRRVLGAKRNVLCEMARGEVIVHWDDDDWSSPRRVSLQAAALADAGADACGIDRVLFLGEGARSAWEYTYPRGGAPWVYGASLCYAKAFWRRNPFAEVAVGEDTRFVWADRRARIAQMPETDFLVALVHGTNTSPKRITDGAWAARSPETIRAVMGSDVFSTYQPGDAPVVRPSEPAVTHPLRNVYACLVHESAECVVDLARNLRYLDPDSRILLYDGSSQGRTLDACLPWSRWNVEIVPRPRPMKWGQLHGFALDCLRYLKAGEAFDVMTVVDSDQLALRAGYPRYLAQRLVDRSGLGLLSSCSERQGQNTRIPPAVTAQKERELWRPFLKRFPDGEEKFVHWTFWPSTVITAEAGAALVEVFDNDQELHRVMQATSLWATEEVLFPTLTAVLGFRVERNPCTHDYVKYRTPFNLSDVDTALQRPDAFWMHPVPRRYDDPIRTRVRLFHAGYERGGKLPRKSSGPYPNQVWPMLRTMRGIEGWLEDEEAELLAIATRDVVSRRQESGCIVEIGSFCGKATFVLASVARSAGTRVRIVAIDTFDGVVGALDRGLQNHGPTLAKFTRMLEQTGLGAWVDRHPGRAPPPAWDRNVDLLVVDGLHDYVNVARDFHAFSAWMPVGSLVAFHDYADYFPGVRVFVDELLAEGEWLEEAHAGSLKLLRRVAASSLDDATRDP